MNAISVWVFGRQGSAIGLQVDWRANVSVSCLDVSTALLGLAERAYVQGDAVLGKLGDARCAKYA